MNSDNVDELKKKLGDIIDQGFQADRKHLKSDMCAQFTDYREWIREYVINAYDAKAGFCKVTGEQTDNIITISVIDNGIGMNKQQLKNFFMLYRSNKDGNEQNAIGMHGIGKLSVAAIPGFKKFALTTSNGIESWQTETDNLLDDKPIVINQLKQVRPQGTRFDISFESNSHLAAEIRNLSNVLKRYVRYIPMDIIVKIPVEENVPEHPITINESWAGGLGDFAKTYKFTHRNKNYELVLSIGSSVHDIYQKRVFITNKYNLLNQDYKSSNSIPFINVKLESADFELPFGRHCISNESDFPFIAEQIQDKYLPDYYLHLAMLTEREIAEEVRFNKNRFHELTIALINNITDYSKPWFTMPVFRLYPNKYISVKQVHDFMYRKLTVYLEDNQASGIDYAVFNSPVILQNQAPGGLKLIKDLLGNKLINLSLNDVIIEAPSNNNLSDLEKEFEKSLFFDPDALRLIDTRNGKSDTKISSNNESHKAKYQRVVDEINEASQVLKSVSWRLSHLVGKDGVTPCTTHKYMISNSTVILNLNHPEIKQMLDLFKYAPSLASHWVMAICITESNEILSHYPYDSKEDLLLIDAMIKLTFGVNKEKADRKKYENFMNLLGQHFNRSDQYNLGLN